MENIQQKSQKSFLQKKDFMRKEFFFGAMGVILAASIVLFYQPALFSSQLIVWFLSLSIFVKSIFWIGRKIVKVVGYVLLIVVIGMVIAIALGNTPAIG